MNNSIHYEKGDTIAGKLTVHEALTGGMGQVYLCFDENGNPIALKTLQANFSLDKTAQQSFKDELRIWASLDWHPNIVRCFGMQILDGNPFITMEWVIGEEGRGARLRDYIDIEPLNIHNAIDFIVDICRGMLHAQRKVPGIVHCDLKPENILIAKGGIAKITDFGLATEGQARTNTSGTPHYMAPEQWTNNPLDSRTDIYALGCIFFELLVGHPPFSAISVDDLHRLHSLSPIPDISEHQPIPQSLKSIIECCMAKDVEKRYQNFQDLLTDLEKVYFDLFNIRPKPLFENKKLNTYELLNKALVYYSVQRVNETLEILDLIIQERPDFLLAYAVRSEVYAGLGKYVLALHDAECAIRIDPSSAWGYLERAVARLNLPDYNLHAFDDVQKAFMLEPNNPFVYIVRSKFNIYLSRYEDALSDIQEAGRYIHDHWIIFITRAQIYCGLGQFDLAQKDIQDCRTQLPYLPLHDKLVILAINAEIYKGLGHYDLALQEINKALQEMPHYSFFLTRAMVLSALHRNNKALDDINHAIKLFPDAVVIYVFRAVMEIVLLRPKDALEDLYFAIDKMPEFWLAHHYFALLLLHMKKPDDALFELDKVREFTKELPLDNLVEFETYIGNAYVQKKEFSEGKKHLDLAISLASNLRPLIRSFAFLQRGLACIDMGLWNQASLDLQTALEYDGDSPQVFLGLGLLSICRGEYEDAKLRFAQVSRLGMNVPYTYQVMISADREKIFEGVMEKTLKVDTFSEFENLRNQEPLLQDPIFVPVFQNMLSIATEEAGLSELPGNWSRILEWMTLSNFGELGEGEQI